MRDDVFQILNALAEDTESQMLRRAFVRSCWAYVEAVTFAVKRYTFSACQLGTVDLAPDDHAFLGDVRLIVDAEGNIAVQKDLTKTLDNVKRTFKLSARIFGVDWKPDFGSEGWRGFRDSLQIRHRLTHPKSVGEVTVSPEDMQTQREGIMWFIKCFNEYQESLFKHYATKA